MFLNELYLTLVSVKCPSLNFILEIWVNSKNYCEAVDRIQHTPPISLLPKVAESHMVTAWTLPLPLKPTGVWSFHHNVPTGDSKDLRDLSPCGWGLTGLPTKLSPWQQGQTRLEETEKGTDRDSTQGRLTCPVRPYLRGLILCNTTEWARGFGLACLLVRRRFVAVLDLFVVICMGVCLHVHLCPLRP